MESAADRAAEPVTLAKLSDYADFIKGQVDAGLRKDKLCRELWHCMQGVPKSTGDLGWVGEESALNLAPPAGQL